LAGAEWVAGPFGAGSAIVTVPKAPLMASEAARPQTIFLVFMVNVLLGIERHWKPEAAFPLPPNCTTGSKGLFFQGMF
jgi:hypothetical protein